VVGYVGEYRPRATIIHSTVPVGATRRVAGGCSKEIEFVHSPVNGLHHEMLHSLVEFPKMLGGLGRGLDGLALEFLRESGFACVPFPSAEDTELAKLLCTLRYGLDIAFEKQVKHLCQELGTDDRFVYREWTDRYNEGYERLHHHEFRRPLMRYVPGPIGGTCVIPNARLLMASHYFAPAEQLLEFNAALEEKEAKPYGNRQDARELAAPQASSPGRD